MGDACRWRDQGGQKGSPMGPPLGSDKRQEIAGVGEKKVNVYTLQLKILLFCAYLTLNTLRCDIFKQNST